MEKFDKGTYAEIYTGSGRYTGRIEKFGPEGPINPTNWVDISGTDEEEFEKDFEWGEHDQCHSPLRPDYSCPYCKEWGWCES